MSAITIRRAGFVLAAIVIGLPLASAQDNPPIVNSETIDVRSLGEMSTSPVEMKQETKQHGAVSVELVAPKEPAVAPNVMAASPIDSAPPQLGVPENCPTFQIASPSQSQPRTIASAPPATLSQTDSAKFASPPPRPNANVVVAKAERSAPRVSMNASRIPKMTKIFSFDTTDKVAASQIAPAYDQFDPELTLNLNGPESVVVNQVFQQLVQVRNASGLQLRDVRVTQVCDLSVLGAERHQAVTIDCLEPGETKTVRFAARALQPGTFAVRYVAENSQIQADIDNSVQVCEGGKSSDRPQ